MIDELDKFCDEKELFKEDSLEQLDNMESTLLDIMDMSIDSISSDMINTLFRAIHTVKGNAGMFRLDKIVSFTHRAESLLDEIRGSKIDLTTDLLEMLLLINDHVKILVNKSVNNETLNDEQQKQNEILIKKMLKYLDIDEVEQEVVEQKKEENNVLIKYNIKIKLKYDFLRTGMDLISIINYLEAIGHIENISIQDTEIPALDELNPLDGYMKFEILYETKELEIEIKEAFEFVQEDIELEILVLDDIKEELPNKEKIVEKEIEEELPKKEIKQNKIESKIYTPPANYSLRVDSSKVDILMKQIGEMVITNAKIIQKIQHSEDSEFEEIVETMSNMLEDIRNGVMNIRMVQVGDALSKLRRIVNDTAKNTGKDIDFQIIGGETELDKTVVEKITDPLVHMLRNSVDHGIELPEIRVKNKKNKKGVITLKAYAHTGSIIIEIQDDGAGIDKNIILQKAIEKQLINSSENLTDSQIYNLIFMPGFSTAQSVSDISGRGVGMDVVKKNIDDLRGTVEIQSKLNIGTTMKIRLPLTLAIIDGFLIRAGDTKYIIPLDMIQECIELTPLRKERLQEDGYITLRSQILPILDIRKYFKEKVASNLKTNIVIVQYGDSQIGLQVDELFGEFQTVIKPLGDLFENLTGVMGGTILGSGDIALILDIPKLIEYKIINNKKGDISYGD